MRASGPGRKGSSIRLLEGRNVLAVMPTGSGKSLCYQVPALARGGLAIVVSPLVALMQDQVAALKLAGVAAETHQFGRGPRRECRHLAKGGGRRGAASLSLARAADDGADDLGPLPARRAADRHRRGALHFAMGCLLPARIRHAAEPAHVLPRRAHRRLHGDGGRGDAARHRGKDLRRGGGGLCRGLRPAQHQPGRGTQGHCQAAAPRFPRRAGGPVRHRLCAVAEIDGGTRRASSSPRAAAPSPITRA